MGTPWMILAAIALLAVVYIVVPVMVDAFLRISASDFAETCEAGDEDPLACREPEFPTLLYAPDRRSARWRKLVSPGAGGQVLAAEHRSDDVDEPGLDRRIGQQPLKHRRRPPDPFRRVSWRQVCLRDAGASPVCLLPRRRVRTSVRLSWSTATFSRWFSIERCFSALGRASVIKHRCRLPVSLNIAARSSQSVSTRRQSRRPGRRCRRSRPGRRRTSRTPWGRSPCPPTR